MSDPLTAQCVYCGSRYVLDDAWFCHELDCYRAYQAEMADDAMANRRLVSLGLTPFDSEARS